ATVDMRLNSIAFSAAGAPPFLSGQARGVVLTVQNAGNVPSNPADTFSCTLAGVALSFPVGSGAVPVIPGGGSTTIPVNFTVPANFAGNNTISCVVSQDPLEAAAVIADNTNNVAVAVNVNVDLVPVGVPVPGAPDMMGSAASVSFSVQNVGLDIAPA